MELRREIRGLFLSNTTGKVQRSGLRLMRLLGTVVVVGAVLEVSVVKNQEDSPDETS